MDYARIRQVKARRNELMEKVEQGDKIFLDCKFCGHPTRVHEDSVISYTEGNESFETICGDCYNPEEYDLDF